MSAEPAVFLQSSSAEPALSDIIHWSRAALDASLLEGAELHERPFVPFVAPRTRWFYWELHFSESRPVRVDFLHRSPLRPLADDARFTSPDPILASLVDWYANSGSARHCHDTAWLEIDGPLTLGQAVRQGVSICLDPEIGRRERGAAPARPSTRSVLEAFSGLQRACGVEPKGTEILAEVQRALDAVGGSARHLSVMRGRRGSPAKIYAALPHTRLREFLEAIAWPGMTEAALQLADLSCAESRAVNLDLSFETALIPRIAYEQFFDPSPARDPSRARATSLARSLGLLTKDQAEALARWVGSFRLSSPSNSFETEVQRWFDLKFVLSPEGLEFKAYLGFRIRDD